MNPQDPYGQQPGQLPQPNAAPQPLPSVVQIPGQQPLQIAPQQPVAPTQQPTIDHSPYEFIMNPGKPAAVPIKLIGGGGSTAKRALIALGGLLVILVAGKIIITTISNPGAKTAPLVTVLQEQTELIRVSTAATQTTGLQQNTQNLAFNVQLGVTSANKELGTYMAGNKMKVAPAVLGLKHDTTADAELQTAQQNSTYDKALRGVLQKDLTDYSQALKAAYLANPGPKGKKLLDDQYGGAQLLLKQSQQ